VSAGDGQIAAFPCPESSLPNSSRKNRTMKMRCKHVRKLLQSMPKGGCQETLRQVSGHLSECESCRKWHAGVRRVEKLLEGRKARLDEIARHSRMSTAGILAGVPAPPAKRAWRFRPAWAGAVVLLLLAAGAVAFFLTGRGSKPKATVTHDTPTPRITQATAAAASSRTLRDLAEVAQRYEAPPPKVFHAPPPFPREPYVPRLLEECRLKSTETLRAIAQVQITGTRRNES
jgi:hypothetical protein